MKLYLAIMAGGAIGSALRFAMSVWVDNRVGESFPWGTIAVNIIGCFLIGLISGITSPDGLFMVSPVVRSFLIIGILGGFTTFSSFSLQTMTLLQDGQWMWATGNVVISVVTCLLATAGGLALAGVVSFKS